MPDSKTGDKAISYAMKKRRALELRSAGWGFKAIADEIGWKSHSSAHDAVMKALKETLQEPADALRVLEAERLNDLYKKCMDRIDNDHLWAVDRALKVMERRASLLGLDASGADDPAEAAQRYLDLYNMAVADAESKAERS
jgi:hypothetical protein